jgi:O-antigen biosynthesis protein
VLSYCESQQIDERGLVLGENYLPYVADVDPIKWRSSFVASGASAVSSLLSVKNTIPNVSAVLFKREAILETLEHQIDQTCSFKVAGDWYVYSQVIAKGRLAFSSKALNKHRRHSKGVTISSVNQAQLDEISTMQTIVATAHDVPNEHVDKARQYIDHLRREHNLPALQNRVAAG